MRELLLHRAIITHCTCVEFTIKIKILSFRESRRLVRCDAVVIVPASAPIWFFFTNSGLATTYDVYLLQYTFFLYVRKTRTRTYNTIRVFTKTCACAFKFYVRRRRVSICNTRARVSRRNRSHDDGRRRFNWIRAIGTPIRRAGRAFGTMITIVFVALCILPPRLLDWGESKMISYRNKTKTRKQQQNIYVYSFRILRARRSSGEMLLRDAAVVARTYC